MIKCIKAALALAAVLAFAGESPAQTCPPNSTPVSTSGGTLVCRCNSGYVMSGGQCVPG